MHHLVVGSTLGFFAGCTPVLPETTSKTPGFPSSSAPSTVPVDTEGLCQVSLACEGNILDGPKTPCALTVRGEDGAIEYEGVAGVELRGRSSLSFPKPQYAVELREFTELPLWPGATWRYTDNSRTLGRTWREPDYDDSDWSVGAAPLGAGQPYLQTELDPEAVTTYLRTSFQLFADPSAIDKVTLGLMRNDGVAVYLNGVEIARDNLPTFATASTLATTPISPTDSVLWMSIDVDPLLFVSGENVLAVELHQADLDTADLRFDAYVEAAGAENPYNLLGMGKEEDWILNGQYVDRVLFRNRLAFDLFQSFGTGDRYATETRFCEMELNGSYVGVYTLGETVKRDDDRLDIGAGEVPGQSFIVELDDRAGFRDNGAGYGMWEIEYPSASPESEALVGAWLAGWEAAVTDAAGDPFDWLDLDSAVDWVILQELLGNHDAYLLSIVLFKDETGGMHFVPWDLDLSIGYPFPDCGPEGWNPRTFVEPVTGHPIEVPFISSFAADPRFRDALVHRWRTLRDAELSQGVIDALIDGYGRTLAPALAANEERWPISNITFEVASADWLCPVSSYAEEHARVVAWLHDRLLWLDEAIETF